MQASAGGRAGPRLQRANICAGRLSDPASLRTVPPLRDTASVCRLCVCVSASHARLFGACGCVSGREGPETNEKVNHHGKNASVVTPFPTRSGLRRLQECRHRRKRLPLLLLRPPRPRRHAHAHRTALQPGTVCLRALTIPCRSLALAEGEEGRHGLGELQAWPRHEVGQGTAGLQEHTEIAAQRQMCAPLPSDAAQRSHAH